MKKQRPVNLQLNTISFPPAAISSITHRITGVAMFFALIFVLWAWAVSLSGPEGFDLVKEVMAGFIGKFIAFGTLAVLIYHIVLGIRHMFMDLGFWEEKESGNTSALVAIGIWFVLTVVAGVVVW